MKTVIIIYMLVLLTSVSSAEVYKWEDANGMHFTDNPSSVPLKYREKAIETAGPDISSSKPKGSSPIQPQYNPPLQPQAKTQVDKTPIAVLRVQQPQLVMQNQYDANKSLEKALEPLAKIISTWILIALLAFIVWLTALVDILRSEFDNASNKVVWLIVILLLPLLGAVLYFIFGSSQKNRRNKEQEELIARLRPGNVDGKKFDIR